jgi:hypothetical protein
MQVYEIGAANHAMWLKQQVHELPEDESKQLSLALKRQFSGEHIQQHSQGIRKFLLEAERVVQYIAMFFEKRDVLLASTHLANVMVELRQLCIGHSPLDATTYWRECPVHCITDTCSSDVRYLVDKLLVALRECTQEGNLAGLCPNKTAVCTHCASILNALTLTKESMILPLELVHTAAAPVNKDTWRNLWQSIEHVARMFFDDADSFLGRLERVKKSEDQEAKAGLFTKIRGLVKCPRFVAGKGRAIHPSTDAVSQLANGPEANGPEVELTETFFRDFDCALGLCSLTGKWFGAKPGVVATQQAQQASGISTHLWTLMQTPLKRINMYSMLFSAVAMANAKDAVCSIKDDTFTFFDRISKDSDSERKADEEAQEVKAQEVKTPRSRMTPRSRIRAQLKRADPDLMANFPGSHGTTIPNHKIQLNKGCDIISQSNSIFRTSMELDTKTREDPFEAPLSTKERALYNELPDWLKIQGIAPITSLLCGVLILGTIWRIETTILQLKKIRARPAFEKGHEALQPSQAVLLVLWTEAKSAWQEAFKIWLPSNGKLGIEFWSTYKYFGLAVVTPILLLFWLVPIVRDSGFEEMFSFGIRVYAFLWFIPVSFCQLPQSVVVCNN